MPLYKGYNWLCPDISGGNIILQNDPATLHFGNNFNFVINFCDISAKRKGININDTNCVTDRTEAFNYFKKNGAAAQYKFIRNYFNPNQFSKTKKMEFLA